ncbi:MAG: hypothetical protein JSS66_03835 [Armatimonadetes bacterium]|nr:hypothetical protein [Armatimonadota bacterium]
MTRHAYTLQKRLVVTVIAIPLATVSLPFAQAKEGTGVPTPAACRSGTDTERA